MGFVPNDGKGGPSNEYAGKDNNIYFQEENVNIEPNNFDWLENIEIDIDNCTPIEPTHDNGRKRKLSIWKQDGAAIRLSKQLNHLCQVVETRPSIIIRNGENGSSIAEVMEVLHNMPEIEIKSELFWKPLKVFLRRIKRCLLQLRIAMFKLSG